MTDEGVYNNLPAGLVIAPTIRTLVGTSKSATRVSAGLQTQQLKL